MNSLTRLSLAALLAAGLSGEPAPEFDVPMCGVTDATERDVIALRDWAERRPRDRARTQAVTPTVEVRDGMFVMPATDLVAPFGRPMDLEGRSLLFTRKNATTFVRTNVPLAYEEMTNATKLTLAADGTASHTLSFDFPFFEQNRRQLTIAKGNAIFFESVTQPGSEQFNDAELAAVNVPVVAPYWVTNAVTGTTRIPAVHILESSDRVSVSWSIDVTSVSWDVQATLFATGDIRFSYKRAKSMWAGGVIITSGSESWRADKVTFLTGTDAANDVSTNIAPSLRPMLDIRSVSVARINASNLLEFRIRTGGTVADLGANDVAVYTVYIGPGSQQYIRLRVTKSGEDTYTIPGWGGVLKSPAARVEGDTIVMYVGQEFLTGQLDLVSVRFYSQPSPGSLTSDTLQMFGGFGQPQRDVRTDFDALTADEAIGPIVEAFTLPVLNVGSVWSRIKEVSGLKDDAVDAVAIYQNFYTDIVLYAGAYSTGGNPGATGVKQNAPLGPSFPLEPALLHMNKLGYGWNSTFNNAGRVMLHELGHRWLLSVAIRQNGQNTRILNPISHHPAQYVHTPAPFVVVDTNDASTMGGATFTDNGNGTFTSPPFDNFSYSGLDLYLMGLAPKEEVKPWFYIENSSPVLEGAYYPPPNQIFSGTRRDVTIDQVIEAIGPRLPAYPDTQRVFKVVYVLMTPPGTEPAGADVAEIGKYRAQLESWFRLATGGRGEVNTTFVPNSALGPRRRSVR